MTQRFATHRFEDLYTGHLGMPEATPRALFSQGLAAMPFWVGGAMRVRNAVVRPFGLKTSMDKADASAGTARDFLARLPVYQEDAATFETGLDDRHLDFRLRLTKTETGEFRLSTRVETHNLMGRIYLAIVMPAHRIIMRAVARGLARPIEENA